MNIKIKRYPLQLMKIMKLSLSCLVLCCSVLALSEPTINGNDVTDFLAKRELK